MTDIVERLRDYAAVGELRLPRLCGEAATEIEGLRVGLQVSQSAVHALASKLGAAEDEKLIMQAIARTTLAAASAVSAAPAFVLPGKWEAKQFVETGRTVVRVPAGSCWKGYQHILELDWGDYGGREDATQLAEFICSAVNSALATSPLARDLAKAMQENETQ